MLGLELVTELRFVLGLELVPELVFVLGFELKSENFIDLFCNFVLKNNKDTRYV